MHTTTRNRVFILLEYYAYSYYSYSSMHTQWVQDVVLTEINIAQSQHKRQCEYDGNRMVSLTIL